MNGRPGHSWAEGNSSRLPHVRVGTFLSPNTDDRRSRYGIHGLVALVEYSTSLDPEDAPLLLKLVLETMSAF